MALCCVGRYINVTTSVFNPVTPEFHVHVENHEISSLKSLRQFSPNFMLSFVS